ncbi:NAD-dependent epimerase/dehydratase family protein [Candidatus Pelagibacter sp.]|nr:NAD-dependent epimerase/dehydratase family protein [Candidatus Pelagibacter sp.]
MTVYLTGSSGYIGSSLKTKLNLLGYDVVPIHHKLFVENQGEMLRQLLSKKLIKNNSIVIHLASSGPLNSLEHDIQSNVVGTENLIRQTSNFGIRKFIVIGTCFEYGLSGNLINKLSVESDLRPAGNHSLSKVFQFHLCQSFAHKLSLDLSYLRPFQVYGGIAEDKERLYPSLISAIKSNKNFKVSLGSQIRDFINIDFLTDFISDEIKLLSGFQVLNVSSGVGTSVREFVEHYWKKHKATSSLIFGALDVKQPLLMRLVGEPSNNKNRRKFDPFYMHPDL